MGGPADKSPVRRAIRRAGIGLVAAVALACAPGIGRASGYESADWPAGTDPSPAEEGVRKVWDVLFWRPIYVVQLVGGVVALPVALPLSALVGSWRDGVDICVTGPAEMAFGRPLGE